MIQNKITINVLLDGQLKKAGVLDPHTKIIEMCKVVDFHMVNGDYILKLKPKNWTTGHTYIYRSLEECF